MQEHSVAITAALTDPWSAADPFCGPRSSSCRAQDLCRSFLWHEQQQERRTYVISSRFQADAEMIITIVATEMIF